MMKWIYLSELELSLTLKYPYAIFLKLGDKCITSLTKLVLKVKAILLYNKKHIFLYFRKLLVFIIVVII